MAINQNVNKDIKIKNHLWFEDITWTKLMPLEVTNRIVDDFDSKPTDFDRRFWSISKSNDEFELTIAILT